MTVAYAPIQEVLAEDNGKPRVTWILFFQDLVNGDIGTSFVPVATNLTVSGTPVITGYFYQNQSFTDFWIRIVPATSITGTAGSTYFELPFTVSNDAPCFATAGLTSDIGAIEAATRRCYPPSFSAVTVPLTITGRVNSHG